MAGFSERRRALVDAAFATFGEEAYWAGMFEPVLVRWKGADEDDRFGPAQLMRRSTILKVRSWQVTPERGEVVEVAAGERAGVWTIVSDPMLDRKGVWDCAVEPVA